MTLKSIEHYRILQDQDTILIATPIEMMNSLDDEHWLVAKKILNSESIVEQCLLHTTLMIEAILEIVNTSSLIPTVKSIVMKIDNYDNCEHIERLKLWAKSINSDSSFSQVYDEYENILELRKEYFESIDKDIEIIRLGIE